MKLIRTAKIKLNISAAEVLPSLQAYTKAFNLVCQVAYNKKITNGVNLHKLTYYQTREDFSLPSQLAISARMKATEAVKSALTKTKHKKYGSCPKSKSCPIILDANSYTLFVEKQQISILMLGGRKRFALAIPEYYNDLFTWKSCSADLCIIKNKVYLHITFEKEIADTQPTGKLFGLDRGINKLAVVSNNKFFGGGIIKKQVRKYQRLRSSLQSKGTKSAQRHLKKLQFKERRFRADINHQISKQIINSLNPGDTLVLENLKGIRGSKMRKLQRTLLNNWSFFQLEQFLIYKAMAKGISIEHCDARYTSQRCSKCGFTCRGNRKTQADFCCKQCGFRLNADLNASRNICNKHLESYKLSDRADVNRLNVGATATYKPTDLSVGN